MDLLRLATVGSVDDGKSTLIGRLLHDAGALHDDQMESLERWRREKGAEAVDLSLVTDGLRAEREQGITIDVAWRHFRTPRRRFVLADCPGHLQYTRNLFTGLTLVDAALVLVDAAKGLTEQTLRHCLLATLFRVPRLVVCANKMDLVGYGEGAFRAVAEDVSRRLSGRLAGTALEFLPVSALEGENVVRRSERMPWFDGEPLISRLESLPVLGEENGPARLPVQMVLRAERRRYAGRLTAGTLRRGDRVYVARSGMESRVRGVFVGESERDEVAAPLAVAVELEDELDIGRGDWMGTAPWVTSEQGEAVLCWLDRVPLSPARRYLLRQGAAECAARVTEILAQVRFPDLTEGPAESLALNGIARVRVATGEALPLTPYAEDRRGGAFILVDETSGRTVAAGMRVAP